jgi:hypothetical protein
LVIAFVLGAMAPSRAATQTLTGQLVDLYCYNPTTKENAASTTGRAARCACACAKWEGQPVGLVASDGKLYQLAGELVANNNAKVSAHITHTVTITGEIADKNGVLLLTASDLKMVSK